MTEADWLNSADPKSMLLVLERFDPSERKTRLFNAAVCRRFWQYLAAESQSVIVESERLADGSISKPADPKKLCERANAVVAPFNRMYPTKQFPTVELRIQRDAAAAVCYAVYPGDLWGAAGYFWDIDPSEKAAHAVIIRDIFGTPFRPITLDSAAVTRDVVRLAEAIYADRAFDRLPILADALEDAGCTNTELLGHLRGPGPHCRGCWGLDLVVGKK
jgi:hypothetical protein